jgi:hypothetical protein
MFDLGRKKVLARLPVLGTTGKEVDVGRSALALLFGALHYQATA